MVNSMQRSAHHAFIMELLGSTDRHCFLNCISDSSLFRRKFIQSNPEKRFINDLNLNLDDEITGNLTPKELLVYSVEMLLTDKALDIFHDEKTKKSAGKSASRFYVTWLRDPINNLASHFNRAKKNAARTGDASSMKIEENEKLKAATEVWVDHWQQVKSQDAGIGIVANLWWRDDEYRTQIFEKLGLAVPHRNLKMTQWGGGSSFEGYHVDQAAPSIEDLESRYELYLDDEDFLAIFRDPEFRNAVEDFFSSFPELGNLSSVWNEIKQNS